MGEVRGLEWLLVHTVLFVDPTSDLNDRDFVSAGCGHLGKLPILSLISFAVENNRFRHIAK